ncbi:MAG: protein-(glutamine-N5) methyltransferase, release factor-specific [Lysobacterales bacterium CG17_big_fil_post_rev_8_21_14_2_50_64_11]|nr:MAG: protein-(glutamine-N5) methyltransferase, release factor-specific [Xanthomonadales bacterium CG17_big_fil_post_rev_8_21_14_2_50_64_11]PIX59326.1 MAG: peptide chain release factor N(5)-glutamine methyltransferase [Xanthomonadales bacterium CG_4_10_14_3_um_filter_64_11]
MTEWRLDIALLQAAARLPGPQPRFEAELLLGHALGRDRAWLFAHGNESLAVAQQTAFTALLERRIGGEPVAYLIGARGFWTLDLAVQPGVLIPRPETELLVELALPRLARDGRLADLGTGSGAIALAIASERPAAHVTAVDISTDALAVAQRNATATGIGNVVFRHGDWLTPLAGERFTVIVSNPPYLAADDPHLQQGDLRFEPALALASGDDGLDAIRRIIADAPSHLTPGGYLLLEHGWTQGEAVRALLAAHGFVEVCTALDLEQRERVTSARWL